MKMHKKLFSLTILVSVAIMAGVYNGRVVQAGSNTAADEAAGKAVFEKLQTQQVKCADLTDDDYDKLGDYYMGQMTGFSHEAMNARLEQRFGADGERQMHIVMGKRLSGCDATAAYPAGSGNLWPMMGAGMMGFSRGGVWPMMANGYWGNWNMMSGFGSLGPLMMLFWLVVIIIIVVALLRGIGGSRWNRNTNNDKTPLDILKERYAKGEINQVEFTEKKKDL